MSASALTIRPYRLEDASNWKACLSASNNGTLFHELDFLDYHPPGRFDFRHLVAVRDGRVEALIPGALLERGYFATPAGASVGGPVLPRHYPLETCLELVEAIQSYARSQGWGGVEIALPPPVYYDQPNQMIEFAFHVKGFGLMHRSMLFMVSLAGGAGERYRQLFAPRRRSYVRANRRKGVTVSEFGAEGLAAFFDLLNDTYSRLGASPTHTTDEITDLMMRLPDRTRIWLAQLDGLAIAGVLLFVVNRNIGCTFYICHRETHREYHGLTVLMAELIDVLAEREFRYLDLGPSASSSHFNRGVVLFKESIGATGFCRDRWRWDVATD